MAGKGFIDRYPPENGTIISLDTAKRPPPLRPSRFVWMRWESGKITASAIFSGYSVKMNITDAGDFSLEIDYRHESAGWIDCYLTFDGLCHLIYASDVLPPFKSWLRAYPRIH
jgi:hypothetical protein